MPFFPLYYPLPPINSDVEFSESSIDTALVELSASDPLHFGRHWPKIKHLKEQGSLEPMIAERRKEILAQKKSWRSFIDEQKRGPLQFLYEEFEKTLSTGTLKPYQYGGGGVYFLYDALGNPRFVVKPEDESILCLNNPKHRGSPFNDTEHRVRDYIPLYRASSTEAAVYALATELDIEQSVTPAAITLIRSSVFYDLSNRLEGAERELFLSVCGSSDQEKLCSFQIYIPDSLDLHQAMHEWFEAGLEQTTPLPIDQEDFENVNLLLWMTYDADGHSSNFRLYFRGINGQGQAYYGLKKIDNGLCLPEKNSYLLNYLGYLPNAKSPLSSPMIAKILQINEVHLDQLLSRYNLGYAKGALSERIEIIKSLASRPYLTIEEMNGRIELLSLPKGKDLALSHLSLEEIALQILTSYENSSTHSSKPWTDSLQRIPWDLHLARSLFHEDAAQHWNSFFYYALQGLGRHIFHRKGELLLEWSDGKPCFYDPLVEKVLSKQGIYIPPMHREEFEGRQFIKIADPLFLKALREIYSQNEITEEYIH